MTGRLSDAANGLAAVRKRLDWLARDRLVGRLSDQDERLYELLCGQERLLLGSVTG